MASPEPLTAPLTAPPGAQRVASSPAIPARPDAVGGNRPSTLLYGYDPDGNSGIAVFRKTLVDGHETKVLHLAVDWSLGYLRAGSTALFQIIEDRRPDIGMGHYEAAPWLTLRDPDGRLVKEVGNGTSGDLSPDGRHFAFFTYDRLRECFGDEAEDPEPCEAPNATLVVLSLKDDSRRTIGPFKEGLGLLWAGPRRIYVFGARKRFWVVDDVFADAASGRAVDFAEPVVDVQTTTGDVLTLGSDLHTLRRRNAAFERVWETSFHPFLIQSSWSPVAERALVSMRKPAGDGPTEGRLAIVDTRDGSVVPVPVPGNVGFPDGDMLWSADGRWYLYRSATERAFYYHLCELATHACSRVTTRDRGVEILALEP